MSNNIVLKYNDWEVTLDSKDPFYLDLVKTSRALTMSERRDLVKMLDGRLQAVDRSADDYDSDAFCVDLAQLAYVYSLTLN